MPRNGSGVFSLPAGTAAVSNTPITSAAYNSRMNDLEADANVARPITAGGTGAVSAPAALAAFCGFTSTATAAGITTLTAASTATQCFTGSLAQTVVLPDTTTLVAGWVYEIINSSTGVLTVNSSGGNVVATVASGTTASLRCILASGTTAASWSALNPIGAGRNHVYNPTGAVNQRDYVSGTATTAANQFTLDRWFVIVSGQNLTFTGTGAARVMTAPAGGVAQVIEGINIAGGTYVLNWTGAATCKVNGTTITKGEPFTLLANINATIAFYSGTFTEVKADKDARTPFVYRDIDTELYSCQRYFEVMLAQQAGMAFSVSNLTFGQRFRVGKRATPTMAATAHGSWVGNNSTGTVSATAFTANIDGYNTDHTGFTGSVVQGYAYVLRSYRHTADAELIA